MSLVQKTAFVVDQGGFHYFFLQQAILQEAVVGILLSILLAFCVLLLATGNYIMASCVPAVRLPV